MNTPHFYLLASLLACVVTAVCVPLLRKYAGRFFLDTPGGLKHHQGAIPAVGGGAIMMGLFASLIFIRLTTHFPTGTLHSLRGVLYGAIIIFILGLFDDTHKPAGVSIPIKLAGQIAATLCLIAYGTHLTLLDSAWVSYPLTFLWVVGITNAFNLLDISDGLCTGQAFVCTLGLYIISLPSEYIYVNFGACALAGACAGFWPYNHISHIKTFLGDSGSTLLGFLLAALSMGAGYSEYSYIGFLAPLLILAIPIFDTSFVTLIRLKQGKNPLLASPDHAAIRLAKVGFSPFSVLWIFVGAGIFFNLLAFLVSHTTGLIAGLIFLVALSLLLLAGWLLAIIRIDNEKK